MSENHLNDLPPTSNPAKRKRRWNRLHASTWVVLFIATAMLVLIVVPGDGVWTNSVSRSRGGGPYELVSGTYDHGWPWSFCTREVVDLEVNPIEQSGTVSLNEIPWLNPTAWKLQSGEQEINHGILICDLAVGLALVALIGGYYEWWRRRRARLWQLGLKELFLLTFAAALPLAWWNHHRQVGRDEKSVIAASGTRTQFVGPRWLAKLVGESRLPFCQHVVSFTTVPAEGQNDCRKLPYLRELTIYEKSVNDNSGEKPQVAFAAENLGWLRDVSGLKVLSISAHHVDAAAWDIIAGLPRLTCLAVADDDLTHEGLAQISKQKQLEELTVTWNEKMSGDDLLLLAALPRLRALKLFKLRQTISLPDLRYLDALPQLRSLSLSASFGQESNLRTLPHLTALTHLDIGSFNVEDQDWVKIGQLDSLESLHLFCVFMSDDNLKHLFGLTHLKTLSLHKASLPSGGEARLHQALPNLKIRYGFF